MKQKMEKTIKAVEEDVATIQVGRAKPDLVEDVMVPAYGGTQQLRVMELAAIQATDAQTLVVNPWDKTVIGEIAKSINGANLGLSAVIDGEIIRIQIPPITAERREELVKLLGQKIESGKVMLRQVRHDKMVEIKKQFEAKELNEDEKFNLEKELQRLLDEAVEDVDKVGKKKEEELRGEG